MIPGIPIVELQNAVERLSTLLFTVSKTPIVFAESCTGGLASASMAAIPGISRFLCGSAVTYRVATKTDWLEIDQQLLERYSAESRMVSESMAVNVLQKTVEAAWSAAITGHLGPDAPRELDGVIFVAVAKRRDDHRELIDSRQISLSHQARVPRQYEATTILLNVLSESLER